jgi:hypothetical protein
LAYFPAPDAPLGLFPAQFLQLPGQVLDPALLPDELMTTAGADWGWFESCEAFRTFAHSWCSGSAFASALQPIIQRPISFLIREPVLPDVSDVIQDDRMRFTRPWPQHTPNLLEV